LIHIYYLGADAWDIVKTGGAIVKDQLPLAAVLTLPATGSEMNSGAVISRRSTHEKFPMGTATGFPQFSILDPTTTYSLPLVQISNGVADAFCHILETYVTHHENRPVQDSMAEGVLKALIHEGPRALKDPTNYECRANIMWACTCALNGWLYPGIPQDWATHMIGMSTSTST